MNYFKNFHKVFDGAEVARQIEDLTGAEVDVLHTPYTDDYGQFRQVKVIAYTDPPIEVAILAERSMLEEGGLRRVRQVQEDLVDTFVSQYTRRTNAAE